MLRETLELFKDTVSNWNKDHAPRLGAALAYYTVFSLGPLLIIVIAIAGLVFGAEAAQGQIVGQMQGLVGEQGAAFIQAAIESASQPRSSVIASVIGIVTLLLGALGVFAQLQDALNTIWDVTPKPDRGWRGLIEDRLLSFSMILVVGFLLLVSLVASTALAAFFKYVGGVVPMTAIMAEGVNFFVSFAVITLLFALIFKYLPDAQIAWSYVWIGAAMTALLFTIGKVILGIYLGNSAVSSAYGAAGSLVVVLVWVYYSAQILFFGAEFTKVYANRYGAGIIPAPNAVRVTEEIGV
ncbi:MAG: YihY/virulence factor BrkB family protein [Acidobacteriota bacterium]